MNNMDDFDYFSRRMPFQILDPKVWEDYDPEDEVRLENVLKRERQECEEACHKHDETLRTLLDMSTLSAGEKRKASSFVREHTRITERYGGNWRSHEGKLKRRWRYRAILECFIEPYCRAFEAKQGAEAGMRHYDEKIRQLHLAVAAGEKEKRDYIWYYYQKKLSSTAIWCD